MRLRVLGSAAGGGFPQWNCACENCVLVRAGDPRVRARTQDSIAVSADGVRWVVVNASPEVLRQIEATPELHPKRGRATPIAAIVLTNGDLDHVLGLFSLRESQPLVVYATDAVREGFFDGQTNALIRTLRRFPEQLELRRLPLDQAIDVAGLSITGRPAPGKLPVHLVGSRTPSPEDNVALWLAHAGRVVVYASAAAAPEKLPLAGEDVVLLDGTFWSSDELVRLQLGSTRAEDMAHAPVQRSLATLNGLRVGRKILTHINNTNPILRDDSPERAAVAAAGWEVAWDGMEIEP